jgi:hypothetical protein
MLADLKEGANNLHAKSAYVDHLKKLCKLDIEKELMKTRDELSIRE